MLTNQLFDQHVSVRNVERGNNDINRLLAAAVVSRQFCSLLLTDPARAISMGYGGEHFSLSAEEYDFVLASRASTLPEFAQQLCKYLPGPKATVKPVLSENYQLRM